MIKLLGLILWSHSVCVCAFLHLSQTNFMEIDRDPVCECLLPTNQKWVAIRPELGSNGIVVTTQLRSNGIRLYLWPFDLKWYHFRPPPTNRSPEYGCDTNADITNQLVITGYFCPSSTGFFFKDPGPDVNAHWQSLSFLFRAVKPQFCFTQGISVPLPKRETVNCFFLPC